MDAIISLPQAAIVKPKRTLLVKTTHAAGEAAADDPLVLHAAIGLAEQIREASNEIERGRRLPPDIVAAMKAAGVFGMAMPRVWGGPELDSFDAVPGDRGTGDGRRFRWMVRDDRLRRRLRHRLSR
jgi:alkylation response protein AidB-like acyl-CoA dehydrogenase